MALWIKIKGFVTNICEKLQKHTDAIISHLLKTPSAHPPSGSLSTYPSSCSPSPAVSLQALHKADHHLLELKTNITRFHPQGALRMNCKGYWWLMCDPRMLWVWKLFCPIPFPLGSTLPLPQGRLEAKDCWKGQPLHQTALQKALSKIVPSKRHTEWAQPHVSLRVF